MTNEKRKLVLFAYTSEWGLAKVCPSFFEPVSGKPNSCDVYSLETICGREVDSNEAIKRLLREIQNRTDAILQLKTWRFDNIMAEMRSAEHLIERLSKGKLQYFQMCNGDGVKIPPGEYDAVVLTSNNAHIDYIEPLIKAGHHVVCEKPQVVITDRNHRADRRQLTQLEKMAVEAPIELKLMDSEHYSAKLATLTFYQNFGEMIARYGRISRISGCSYEKDDPGKIRTRKMLCRENQTGLLLDMGVHFFTIVSVLGGDVSEILRTRYSYYPGDKGHNSHDSSPPFDVETYVDTSFHMNGSLFHDNAQGDFQFIKFINRLLKPMTEDKKQLYVTCKKGGKETKITLDFNKGTVIDSTGRVWNPLLGAIIPQNEYSYILLHQYDSIVKNQQPRTSMANSLNVLHILYRHYETFPVEGNLIQVYQK